MSDEKPIFAPIGNPENHPGKTELEAMIESAKKIAQWANDFYSVNDAEKITGSDHLAEACHNAMKVVRNLQLFETQLRLVAIHDTRPKIRPPIDGKFAAPIPDADGWVTGD